MSVAKGMVISMNVLYETRDSVAIITLNRPDAMNSLNLGLLRELERAISQAEDSLDVNVLIITGTGRAFVAGADIQQMKGLAPNDARAFGKYGSSVLSKIEAISKPVIAAVNGYALGGGCELCLACDIRIAGTKAKFGQPEVSLGITPGFGGTQRLPRVVGVAKAKELIYTAKTIDAEEAMQIGLVNKVVPDEELMDEAMAMAIQISQNAQIAVRQCKQVINKGIQCDIQTGLTLEVQAFALCFSTEDQKDAMTAFVNKTKLEKFKGK